MFQTFEDLESVEDKQADTQAIGKLLQDHSKGMFNDMLIL